MQSQRLESSLSCSILGPAPLIVSGGDIWKVPILIAKCGSSYTEAVSQKPAYLRRELSNLESLGFTHTKRIFPFLAPTLFNQLSRKGSTFTE